MVRGGGSDASNAPLPQFTHKRRAHKGGGGGLASKQGLKVNTSRNQKRKDTNLYWVHPDFSLYFCLHFASVCLFGASNAIWSWSLLCGRAGGEVGWGWRKCDCNEFRLSGDVGRAGGAEGMGMPEEGEELKMVLEDPFQVTGSRYLVKGASDVWVKGWWWCERGGGRGHRPTWVPLGTSSPPNRPLCSYLGVLRLKAYINIRVHILLYM